MIANPKIDLWATDEVHFQQHGSRCRMWIAPEESDPVVLQEPTRKSVGYFGAVRLRDGKFIYRREENKFNADTFWAFLKQLRKASSHSGKRFISFLITPVTTMPSCINNTAQTVLIDSPLIFCLLTARISILLNGFGN